jgi:uncharacterized membrane protein
VNELRLGSIIFAVSLVGFGVQNFMYTGFLAGLEFVPEWLPLHSLWAYFAGAVLLVVAGCLISRKYASVSVLLLGALLLLSAFSMVPRVVSSPHDLRERTRILEMLSLCAGAWLFAGVLPGSIQPEVTAKAAFGGRLFFGFALVIFGVDHLEIPAFIATLIPTWIPFRLFWAVFTGFAMIAGGISIAFSKWNRQSGVLLGVMFFLWVLILHGPRVAGALHNGNEWNSALVALAMAGCSLVAAFSEFSPRVVTVPAVSAA